MRDLLRIPFETWKLLVSNHPGWAHYHLDSADEFTVVYTGTSGHYFSAEVADDAYSDWLTNYSSGSQLVETDEDAISRIFGLSGVLPPAVNKRGRDIVTPSPSDDRRLEIMSPNWCDRRTWFYNSVQVVDEILTDSGDGLTFNPATNRVWIDVMNGRLTGERALRAQYAPAIEVDSVGVVEHPTATLDGDYSVDYLTGAVTFSSVQSGKSVVARSYYYENGSAWAIIPSPGKRVRISSVEVQFSADIVLTDTVLFQAYGLADVFAPQLLTSASPPGPYPPGTKIPLGTATHYQTMGDFINESSLAYPPIQKIGGNGWRGLAADIHLFRWPYGERGTTDLADSQGLEIRISLESDTEFLGSTAVATFYGTSEDE